MATGKIKWFDEQKGFGRIELEDGSDLFIHIKQWRGPKESKPEQGQTVTFEVGKYQERSEAKNVRPTQASSQTSQKQEQKPYHFLNPYNFVRFLDKPRPDDHILGNCSPPPHDRYVGLTGRVECEVEAVTPLFVSDSHAVEDDKGHKSYRFFQYEGQSAIPASSLRGMVRSVFEAVTNSCFSVFEKDDPYPLEHREARAPDMYPARVVKIGTDGGATLELLDCALNAPNMPSGPALARTGAVIQAYPPRVFNPKITKAFNKEQSHLPENAKDGMRVAALIRIQPTVHRSGRFRSFIVERIVPTDQHQSLQPNNQVRKVFGWLHLTGPNIENKHDERLFFRWDDTQPMPSPLNQIPGVYLVECESKEIAEYNRHLKEYWQRHQRTVENLGNERWPNGVKNLPQPSLFVQENRQLEEKDLVYIQKDSKNRVTMLRPVSMPRVRYFYPRQQFLSLHLKHCAEFDELCPACRTFGWVWQASKKGVERPKDKPTAYAGRIQFTHATAEAIEIDDKPRKLAVLSSPKPTTTSFYLMRADGRVGEVTYDSPDARLRGRKFYRHFGNSFSWSEASPVQIKATDQNRSLRDVVKSGSRFSFKINFENLAEVELGALLWALELEEGMYHRLGFAKPLGLGSLKLSIKKLEILDYQARYQELREGWLEQSDKAKTKYIGTFKDVMQQIYGSNFDQLMNVRDLKALFSEPPVSNIHYPRSEQEPNAQGENFKWFVGNKRRRPAQGGALKLSLAEDDTKGFPLMDERGQESN